MPEISAGDTAWVLVSAALVLLMTAPGLALFYGGMVRAKSTLNMMMMSFGALFVVGIIWVVYGYSVAFGPALDAGSFLGDPSAYFGLNGLLNTSAMALNGGYYPIPATAFIVFQAMFAVITVALISGAIADRARFGTWLVFAAIWVTIVYLPVARAVFYFGDQDANGGGFIATKIGALDFAGGTAVHINAGAAGLALALVLGKRIGFGKMLLRPSNLPLVMIGAGLLWFGWFGFNAGSALGANGLAGVAFVNTLSATCAAALGWLLVERLRDGHATSLGAASGIVAGLVAITPACAFVDTAGALSIGVIAGAMTALAVGLKYRFGYDDSLDVVGVHLVGGLVGTILIGFFGTTSVNEFSVDGLFYGGGASQLVKQIQAALIVMIFSFVVTYILGTILSKTIGFRVSREEELEGVDIVSQAESAYDLVDSSKGSSKGKSA
ncbi:MAG: ammonium transporter [Actinomycetota bacterium]|nr:ammonium transporter [Actinomycetota bacterium]MDA3026365.1 ammonium transporter [Actinomycetota bacterium]